MAEGERTALLENNPKPSVAKEKIQEDMPRTPKPGNNEVVETDTEKEMMDTRRNHGGDRKKLYEAMLLNDLPGTNTTNEPMHAVLEGELGKSETDGHGGQHARDHALIHYLANLANSNKDDDTFDFDFVESLLRSGANVNCTDKTGQTIFHEVARSWNIDVALFLVRYGANVNQQDQFGRSPLHVAAAVDYAEMVEFLLQNGADINIRTYGEEQSPVHFAAKNDAVNSVEMLLAYKADIDARDSRNRTPLQVSAEMSCSKAAKLLVTAGAPAGVYDSSGNSALSLLIEKIPEVALIAMDQFRSTDIINRKEFYFLNYLEGPKMKDRETPARSPLEIAVHNERSDIILHPVMQRLIGIKWRMYGKRGAIRDLVLNLLYTILWTVVGVTIPRNGRELYIPIREHIWRLVIVALLCLSTVKKISYHFINTIKTRKNLTKWRDWRVEQLSQDRQYCHPRWKQENKYLESEIEAVMDLNLIHTSDGWIYFDWFAVVLILATMTTHVTFFCYSTEISKEVHHYFMITTLLVLWFRTLKYARPFESAGPFVVIFRSVFADVAKWALLFSVVIVPYACAFWITFGPTSLHPVNAYSRVGPLIYNVLTMMVVGDYGKKDLEEANPILSRILCGSFIAIAAIVTLNLLIALLTNTFERLYSHAVANAVMQRARTILLLQKTLRKSQINNYYKFIEKKGSPEVVYSKLGGLMTRNFEDRATIDRVCDDVETIKVILRRRFGRRYGNGTKTEMEFAKEALHEVKKLEQKLERNTKMILQQMGVYLAPNNRSNRNNNNNNNNNSNNNNNNSDDNNDGDDNLSTTSTAQRSIEPRYNKGKRQRRRKDDRRDSETAFYHQFSNRPGKYEADILYGLPYPNSEEAAYHFSPVARENQPEFLPGSYLQSGFHSGMSDPAPQRYWSNSSIPRAMRAAYPTKPSTFHTAAPYIYEQKRQVEAPEYRSGSAEYRRGSLAHHLSSDYYRQRPGTPGLLWQQPYQARQDPRQGNVPSRGELGERNYNGYDMENDMASLYHSRLSLGPDYRGIEPREHRRMVDLGPEDPLEFPENNFSVQVTPQKVSPPRGFQSYSREEDGRPSLSQVLPLVDPKGRRQSERNQELSRDLSRRRAYSEQRSKQLRTTSLPMVVPARNGSRRKEVREDREGAAGIDHVTSSGNQFAERAFYTKEVRDVSRKSQTQTSGDDQSHVENAEGKEKVKSSIPKAASAVADVARKWLSIAKKINKGEDEEGQADLPGKGAAVNGEEGDTKF